MIKVKQILATVERHSCDNCNREMPLIYKYSFCDSKNIEYNKIYLCEDCGNAVSKLFYKVMKNGKSFKYEKDEFEEEV